jgi:G-protein alpha subunit
MKILHLNGFADEDRQGYKATIYNNTIGTMRVLVSACQELEEEVEDRHKEVVERIYSGDHYFQGQITTQIAEDIESLWTDKGIRAIYERQAEFQLNDSAAYFFENVRRMADPDYLPSDQDILRSRSKTTGIVETSFKLENITFRMIDVGGQRSERKKWLHCFQDITSAIFCVATPEYDLKLYEDDETNRMHESIRLFREICNNKWFVETSTILFLNKDDIFREKIQKVDLNVCFPAYTGLPTLSLIEIFFFNSFFFPF